MTVRLIRKPPPSIPPTIPPIAPEDRPPLPGGVDMLTVIGEVVAAATVPDEDVPEAGLVTACVGIEEAIVLVILVPRVLDVEVPPVVPGGKVFVAVDVRKVNTLSGIPEG